MIPALRRQKIIEILKEDESVQVSSLAEIFKVSLLTIRRDLDYLSKKNLLDRSFGGAITKASIISEETQFDKKLKDQIDEKKLIAKGALKFIEDKDVLFINSGTTTLELIKLLFDKDVSIVTNNIEASLYYKSTSKAKLIFLGGLYRSKSHSTSGYLSDFVLDNINANKVIIGVDGLSLKGGLTTPIISEAQTTSHMISRTIGNVICLASSNKIGVISNYKTADIDQISMLITDEKSRKLLDQKQLDKFNIKVIYLKK